MTSVVPQPYLHACPFCQMDLPHPGEAEKTARSYLQHKRFFAMIRAAYFHWPEAYPVQWTKGNRTIGEHEARMWLLARVGHGDKVGSVPVTGMSPNAARTLAKELLAMAGAEAISVVRGGDIIIVRPRSIAFPERGGPTHKEFCDISDRVQAEIERICGAPMDELISTTPAPPRRRKAVEHHAA